MRTLLSLAFCLAAADSGFAQHVGGGPACEAPAPYQQQCGPANGCQPGNPPCVPTNPRDIPRDIPPEVPSVPREIGSYVAPPRAGTTRGATNYRGLDFGTITLPELKLRMPSIELPHCFHGRSSARMLIDSAVAPWESQGFVNTAAPQAVATQDRAAPSSRDVHDRAATERAACEEYSRRLKQYEDELRRIEDQRRNLEDCIRQCLEANRSLPPNLPRSEMGCLSPDNRSLKPGGPQPITQPIAPPQPPVDNGAHRYQPPPTFPEQPASYLAEPAPLTPPRPWITQPSAPPARITGLHIPR